MPYTDTSADAVALRAATLVHYSFDETSGETRAVDDAGSAKHLTASATPPGYGAGKIDGGRTLDTATPKIFTRADEGAGDPFRIKGRAFYISFWLKPANTGAIYGTLGKDGVFYSYVGTDGSYHFGFSKESGGTAELTGGDCVVNFGQWNFIEIFGEPGWKQLVVNRGDGIYYGGFPTVADSANDFVVQADGAIDELLVLNIAPTLEQVNYLYNSGAGRNIFAVSAGPPVDTTPPALSSATINAAGNSLRLVLTEADSLPLLPATGAAGFTLSGSHTLSAGVRAGTTGSDARTFDFPVSPVVYSDETLTLAYDDAAGNITDSAATPNELNDFSGATVTNNSTQAAPSYVPPAINLSDPDLLYSMEQTDAFVDGWTNPAVGAPFTASDNHAAEPGFSDTIARLFEEVTTPAPPNSQKAIRMYGGTYSPNAYFAIDLAGAMPRTGWTAQVDFALTAGGVTKAGTSNGDFSVLSFPYSGQSDPYRVVLSNNKIVTRWPGQGDATFDLPAGMAGWTANTYYRLTVVFPDLVANPNAGASLYLNDALVGTAWGGLSPGKTEYADLRESKSSLIGANNPNGHLLVWSGLTLYTSRRAPGSSAPGSADTGVITADFAASGTTPLSRTLPGIVFPIWPDAQNTIADAIGTVRLSDLTSEVKRYSTAGAGRTLFEGVYYDFANLDFHRQRIIAGQKLHLTFGYNLSVLDSGAFGDHNAPDSGDYTAWVQTNKAILSYLVGLYGADAIASYTIWNEPSGYGMTETGDDDIYVALFPLMRTMVSALCPDAKSLVGEFDWGKPFVQSVMAKLKATSIVPDGFASHLYVSDNSEIKAEFDAVKAFWASPTGFNTQVAPYLALTETNIDLEFMNNYKALQQPAKAWAGAHMLQAWDVCAAENVHASVHFTGIDQNGDPGATQYDIYRTGLFTVDAKPKPVAHVYSLYSKLEDTRLPETSGARWGVGSFVTRNTAGDSLAILGYRPQVNFPADKSYTVRHRVENITAGSLTVTECYRVDKSHSSPLEQGGSATGALVNEVNLPTITYSGGGANIDVPTQPGSFHLVKLSVGSTPALTGIVVSKDAVNGDGDVVFHAAPTPSGADASGGAWATDHGTLTPSGLDAALDVSSLAEGQTATVSYTKSGITGTQTYTRPVTAVAVTLSQSTLYVGGWTTGQVTVSGTGSFSPAYALSRSSAAVTAGIVLIDGGDGTFRLLVPAGASPATLTGAIIATSTQDNTKSGTANLTIQALPTGGGSGSGGEGSGEVVLSESGLAAVAAAVYQALGGGVPQTLAGIASLPLLNQIAARVAVGGVERTVDGGTVTLVMPAPDGSTLTLTQNGDTQTTSYAQAE